MDTLDWFRVVSASFFFVEFVAYSVTAFIFYQRYYHAFTSVLFHNIIISGLNMLLTVYLIDGGALYWAWLVYSFSCVYLNATSYRVLTYDVSGCQYHRLDTDGDLSVIERDPPYTYYIMCISTFITIVSGFVINLIDSQALRWLVFFLDFVPFTFAIMFLFRSAQIINGERDVSRRWARWSVYINLAFWFGYPIVMVLGPLFTGTISGRQEALGYVILDIVTKHTSMALNAGYMGVEVQESVRKHCIEKKKDLCIPIKTIASTARL